MCQEVHGAVQHGPCVRDGLEDAVDGMEGQASEGRQGVVLVVLVVSCVQVPERRIQRSWAGHGFILPMLYTFSTTHELLLLLTCTPT